MSNKIRTYHRYHINIYLYIKVKGCTYVPCHTGYGMFHMVTSLALSHAGRGDKNDLFSSYAYLPNANNVYLTCVLFTQ